MALAAGIRQDLENQCQTRHLYRTFHGARFHKGFIPDGINAFDRIVVPVEENPFRFRFHAYQMRDIPFIIHFIVKGEYLFHDCLPCLPCRCRIASGILLFAFRPP